MSRTVDSLLGTHARLWVRKLAPEGALLALDDDPEGFFLLLPRAELPEDVRRGDEFEVFVALDSEDRPIATRRSPKLALHEVAFLQVRDVTRFGAFVDWGLPKQLLVPFAEQTRTLEVGAVHPFGLIRDSSGRLAATMRIRELLHEGGDFRVGEWVEGEAWRSEPDIGVFVILERRFVGLLPAREPHTLRRGEAASFRVVHVWPDGKLELSLRGLAHDQLEDDAEHVLRVLQDARAPAVSDRTSPEQIRALFGLSKKAFKRALGRLLRERKVALDARGGVVLR